MNPVRPQPLRANHPVAHRGGFTLVELLAVMAIMAVLIGLAGTVASRIGTGGGVDNAVSVFRSQMETAQTLARSRGVHTRLLILDKWDPDSRDRYRNYLQVVYLSDDGSGSPVWAPAGNGFSLPDNAVFDPDLSRGELRLNSPEMSQFTVDGQPVSVSGPQLGLDFKGVGEGDWFAYGFNSTGSPVNPKEDNRLDVIVRAGGGFQRQGQFEQPLKNRSQTGGFAITRYGNTLPFRDAAYIETITGGQFSLNK